MDKLYRKESLLNQKTPSIIANEIIMSRSVLAYERSYLLVEGPDDSKFWHSRVSHEYCEIVITEGKPNLVGAIGNLDAREFVGALGIIDDEGDSLENKVKLSTNLITTDAHDLECMLLKSSALERGVLAELGNKSKIEAFQNASSQSVRDRLLENGLAFGRLRWLSKRKAWELSFDILKPERFMDNEAWLVDIENLVRLAATLGTHASAEEIGDMIKALPDADPWLVCQGHDLLDILRLGLQNVLGEMKASHGRSHLAALLRAAFQDVHFAVTQLYQNIRAWEQSNAPYQVLLLH